jgi:hypothetical protein
MDIVKWMLDIGMIVPLLYEINMRLMKGSEKMIRMDIEMCLRGTDYITGMHIRAWPCCFRFAISPGHPLDHAFQRLYLKEVAPWTNKVIYYSTVHFQWQITILDFWSPERIAWILPPGKGYSFPVDIWALGICFYFMLYQGASRGKSHYILVCPTQNPKSLMVPPRA